MVGGASEASVEARALVCRDHRVSLAYVLFDEHGQPVDSASADEPLIYVHGYAEILPGLERTLEGLAVGARVEGTFDPSEAFGEFDEEGVFEVERAIFPGGEDVLVGDEFVAEGADGEPIAMRVIEVHDDALVVDTNHPLAGQRIRFEVEVADIRRAEPAEIELAKGRAKTQTVHQNGELDEQD